MRSSRLATRVPGPPEVKGTAVKSASAPRSPSPWFDLVKVIIKCAATLAGEWIMKTGGHF